MQTQRTRKRTGVALIAASLTLVLPSHGDLTADFRTEAEAIRAQLVAVQGHWYRMLSELPPESGRAPVVLRMTLSGAIFGRDIRLELVCSRTGCYHARAWAPRWNLMIHPADGTGLKLLGDGRRGTLNGGLRVTLLPDAALPLGSEPIAATLNLKAELSSGEISGLFTSEASGAKVRGDVSGTAHDCAGLDTATGLPDPAMKKLNAYDLYGAAVGYEAELCRIYRHVRATAVAKQRKTQYGRALRLVSMPVPARPSLEQKVKKKPVETDELEKTGPSLDDLSDDLGLGNVDETGPAAPLVRTMQDIATNPLAKERLRTLRVMHAHVDEILEVVGAHVAAAVEPSYQAGTADIADPLFGPWYGGEPLPAGRKAANRIPADAGAGELQNWPYVRGWQVVGPLPGKDWALNTPDLPEFFGADATKYAAKPVWDEHCRERNIGYNGPAEIGWEPLKENAGTGAVTPSGDQRKGPEPMVYAFTDIESEEDVELWMAAGVDDLLKVWVNGNLVAVTPDGAARDLLERMFLFRARFRKGTNRVMVRCDSESGGMHFWLRACTSGRPGDPATSRARLAAMEKRRETIRNTPANVFGFRKDSTAYYPNATPVTAWDIEKKINVRWRTRFDSFSKSQPVVLGDRVYTHIDPHFLVCLNKHSGKILWQRESNVLELVAPDRVAEAAAMYEAYQQVSAVDGKDRWKKRKEWQSFILRHGKCVKSSHWDGGPGGPWTGYTFASPVTDGKHLWVKYGTGVAACYDLDGNRKWMSRIPFEFGGDAPLLPSPVLVGDTEAGAGKVVVQFPARYEGRNKTGLDRLMAFDAGTGAVLWTAQSDVGSGSCTPLVMRLSDGKEEMDVIVTGGGMVVRADDGRILVRSSPGYPTSLGPTAVGDTFFRYGWKYGIGTATQLLMVNRDRIGVRRRWVAPPSACASGWAYCGGYLYALAGSQFGGPYKILDAATGTEVERRVNVGVGGVGVWSVEGRTDSYVPTTIAGDHIFLATRGARERKDPWARVTVVQLGVDGRFVAHNKMEVALQSPPVFDEDRIYIRNEPFLTCLAYTGEEGRAYEAEENARRIFEDMRPAPPPAREALAPAPDPELNPPQRGRPFGSMIPDLTRVFFAGPFPLSAKDDVLAGLGGPRKARLAAGRTVKGGGVVHKAIRFSKEQSGKYAARKGGKPCMDLLKPIENAANTVSYYYCVVGTDRPRTMRVSYTEPGVSAWLGGLPVRDQDRVALEAGGYPLLIESKVEEIPAAGKTLLLEMSDSSDAADECRFWRESLERNRTIFERVVKYRPDSDLAAKAKKCLAQL